MSKLHRVEALMGKHIDWPIHRDAVRLISMHEDCRLMPYLCPAGVWTCGWGETQGVVPGKRWTQEYADERFLAALREYAGEVERMLKVPASPQQLGALVCLGYNIGLGALRKSTVLKRHNAADFGGAARAFGLWNKARVSGQLQALPGLTARRAAESALYLQHDPEEPSERQVQAVSGESSLASSPIAQGGVVTAGAGAVSLVSELAAADSLTDAIGPVAAVTAQVKAIVVDTLALPGWVMPALLIAAGVAVLYWRWRQRSGGWA